MRRISPLRTKVGGAQCEIRAVFRQKPAGARPARHHIIIGGRSTVAPKNQKVTGIVKLQIPAGKATPAPPVGPALGQHGVNIAAFTK